MRRSILFLEFGLFFTAQLIDVISVFVFHDVDRDQIGHLNQAFKGLCAESALFALVVGGAAGLFTLLGTLLFHLRGYSPRAKVCVLLGVAIIVLQYPWDFLARKLFPEFADAALFIYLLISIVLCTVVMLRDTFRQRKMFEAGDAPLPA